MRSLPLYSATLKLRRIFNTSNPSYIIRNFLFVEILLLSNFKSFRIFWLCDHYQLTFPEIKILTRTFPILLKCFTMSHSLSSGMITRFFFICLTIFLFLLRRVKLAKNAVMVFFSFLVLLY